MLIKVKVSANAKKESVVKKSNDLFKISVKEPKERGQANKRVLELVRKYFTMYTIGSIKIVSGHHAQNKIINIDIKK